MNMLFWEVVMLVRLQLIKELKAFGRSLQKTDHSGGDSSLRNFPILDLLKLEIQYWENVLDIVSWIYFDKSSMISLKDGIVISNYPLSPFRFIRQCFMANSCLFWRQNLSEFLNNCRIPRSAGEIWETSSDILEVHSVAL